MEKITSLRCLITPRKTIRLSGVVCPGQRGGRKPDMIISLIPRSLVSPLQWAPAELNNIKP